MNLLYQIYRCGTDETDRTPFVGLRVVPKLYPINGVEVKNVVGMKYLRWWS